LTCAALAAASFPAPSQQFALEHRLEADIMPDTPTIPPDPHEARWDRLPMTALERIRIPYGWIVLGLALLGIVCLAFDVLLHYAMRGIWPAYEVAFGTLGIIAAIYLLLALRFIKRESKRALRQIRRSVEIDDQRFESFARRLLVADGRVEAVLAAAAVLLVIFFLVLPPDQLPELAARGAVGGIGSAVIVLFYALLFWLLLSLVYVGIRSSRALSQLAKQPLTVNVFDPEPLLPFGRLSLAQSLTFVGMFLIPLIIMGPPTRQGGGWLVIGLSVVCLLALFVPLWGVHRQIIEAREEVLERVCGDLMEVQRTLLSPAVPDSEQLRALSQRTEVLLQFRKQILGAPSWPFRDTGSIFRATIAALSPLIYFILNELVQSYLFPLFGLK